MSLALRNMAGAVNVSNVRRYFADTVFMQLDLLVFVMDIQNGVYAVGLFRL